MIEAGYRTLFHEVGIPEAILLKIQKNFNRNDIAKKPADIVDFDETIRDS